MSAAVETASSAALAAFKNAGMSADQAQGVLVTVLTLVYAVVQDELSQLTITDPQPPPGAPTPNA